MASRVRAGVESGETGGRAVASTIGSTEIPIVGEKGVDGSIPGELRITSAMPVSRPAARPSHSRKAGSRGRQVVRRICEAKIPVSSVARRPGSP